MLIDQIKTHYIDKNRNCAESLVLGANDFYSLGLEEQAVKLIAGFGKGCGCGKTCGAIAGALGVLGVLAVKGNAHATPGFDALCAGLAERLEEALGGWDCKDLRPCYVRECVRCLDCVSRTAEVLEQYLQEQGKA